MEKDLQNNIFVNAFINEYDAYIYSHPEVRAVAGLILYIPRKSRNLTTVDKYDFGDYDKLFLFSVITCHQYPELVKEINTSDIVISRIPEAIKKILLQQWIKIFSDDQLSHPKVVYRMLHNPNVPTNTLMPLLNSIGVDSRVFMDIDLSEAEFISKYQYSLWLPINISKDNEDAICRLLCLGVFETVRDFKAPSFSNYGLEALGEFVNYYCILRALHLVHLKNL